MKVKLVIIVGNEEKLLYEDRKGTYFKNNKDKIYIDLPYYETIVKVEKYGFCAIRIKKEVRKWRI